MLRTPQHHSYRMNSATWALASAIAIRIAIFLQGKDLGFEVGMRDLMNTLALICAALASLGLGVMLAYAVCRAGFALLRLQAPRSESSAAPAKTQTIEA